MATTGAEVYAQLVQSLFDAEITRKSTLEQKATGIIASSGTLVSLLFALVEVVTKAANFSLPRSSHPWLMASVVFFSLAIALSVAIAVPIPYGETEITAAELQSWWVDGLSDAEFAVAELQLQRIETARRRNRLKVYGLLGAMGSQFLGLAMLTVAVILVLR